MNQFSKTIYYRLPVIALCTFIFWQSSYPGIISEPLFPYDDKVLHFIVYGLLAFLCVRWLSVESFSPKRVKTAAIIFTILFGLSDEIHQSFVPERYASGFDLLADAVGAFAGVAAFMIFNRYVRPAEKRTVK